MVENSMVKSAEIALLFFSLIRIAFRHTSAMSNHSISRLDTHRNLTYLCAVTFKNNDYGKRKSKLPGGV